MHWPIALASCREGCLHWGQLHIFDGNMETCTTFILYIERHRIRPRPIWTVFGNGSKPHSPALRLSRRRTTANSASVFRPLQHHCVARMKALTKMEGVRSNSIQTPDLPQAPAITVPETSLSSWNGTRILWGSSIIQSARHR